MQDRKIGDVRVTRIEEQMGPGFPAKDFFPEFEADTFAAEQHWLAPSYYVPESGRLLASIHSWLVRTDKYTILIDACSGNHKPRPGMPRFDMLNTKYLDRLRASLGLGHAAHETILHRLGREFRHRHADSALRQDIGGLVGGGDVGEPQFFRRQFMQIFPGRHAERQR